MGHAQSGETNRPGRKNILIFIYNFNIVYKYFNEVNQTFFLSRVEITRGSKSFYKMAVPQLHDSLEKIDLSIFSKQELSSFRLAFASNSFLLELEESGD